MGSRACRMTTVYEFGCSFWADNASPCFVSGISCRSFYSPSLMISMIFSPGAESFYSCSFRPL